VWSGLAIPQEVFDLLSQKAVVMPRPAGSAYSAWSKAVSVGCDVDLSSAVVAYRPAAGEERSVAAQEVSSVALLKAAPWRTFRWYFGQRHYSGTYWCATQRDHVIYESRLELANLLLDDFDPKVRHIVAQLFVLRAQVGGQVRKHILDYLLDSDDGPVVVDVVRRERMIQPEIALLCAWTHQIVESLGWAYLVANEPPRIRLANVRFLAGYRREAPREASRIACSRPMPEPPPVTMATRPPKSRRLTDPFH
jgi:hypothetical protein